MKRSLPVVAAALALAVAVSACKKGDGGAAGSGSAAPSGTGAGTGTAAGSDPWASTPSRGSGAASGSAAASDVVQGTCNATQAKPFDGKLTKPFFFRARKSGAHDVYLFGTIHLGVDPKSIPDWVLDKLDHAQAFAMETDINDPSLLSSVMRQDGKKLEDELGPVAWKKFVAAVGTRTAEAFQGMKASAAATVLDICGMPITTPIDLFLLQRAKGAQKDVVFLEPGAKQLALLDKWMDARALAASLDDVGEGQKKNGELIAAYIAGDDAKAVAMSQDEADFIKSGRSHDEFTQMMKEMLFDRNASWIPEIDTMAKQGEGFVAVGAMHLLGPQSVVDLLGKDGWTVDRLSPP